VIGRRGFLAGALGLAAGAAQAQVLRPNVSTGFRAGFRFLGTDDPDVLAYIATLTTPPSATERGRLNALVTGLKQDGVWALLDRLNVLAAETSQAGLRDLRNPSKTLAIGGTVTFTADRGFQGDGTTGYLDVGEIFNASGNQFAQNSATVGVWCNLAGTTGIKPHFGNLANAARTQINARDSAGNENFRFNDSSDDTFMATTGSRMGHRAATRTGATTKKGFFAGAVVASLTTASTGVNTTNGCLLRSATSFADDRLAAFYSGAGMSDAQLAAIHPRLNTYLSSKGAA
jgi:hypothetical protein